MQTILSFLPLLLFPVGTTGWSPPRWGWQTSSLLPPPTSLQQRPFLLLLLVMLPWLLGQSASALMKIPSSLPCLLSLALSPCHFRPVSAAYSWEEFIAIAEQVKGKRISYIVGVQSKPPNLFNAMFVKRNAKRTLYLRSRLFKFSKGWGLSAKLGKHSAIWGKLGTALQAYTLNPCTKFPPNPTSRKVNT